MQTNEIIELKKEDDGEPVPAIFVCRICYRTRTVFALLHGEYKVFPPVFM